MKKCPYCAEAIQDDAQTCPLCHMNLTANVYPARPVPPPPQQPTYAPPPPSPSPLSGGAYSAVPPAVGQRQTSGKAIGSLICGIAGLLIPFFGGIVAIILGHIGLSEIRKSSGRLTGEGLAIGGLVLGYLEGVLFVFLIIPAILIPNLLRSRMVANEATAVGSLRTITTAEITYASMCPKIGFANSLSEMGPNGSACPEGKDQIDSMLAMGDKRGYRFTPSTGNFSGQAPETTFGWNADPSSPSSGTRHFFVDQTGVIRYSTAGQANAESSMLQ